MTRLVRTFAPLVGLLVLMASLTERAGHRLSNADTWFHLTIGRGLLGPWSLSHPGRLSAFGDVPWLPTQWSTELLVAGIEARFGLPGVAWLFGALFLALVLAVYAACRAHGDRLCSAVATAAAVLATSAALSARPQVVTLILLVVVVSAWLRAERDLRVPWHLVPLTWLWATAHGMWTVGVVVGLVCWTGLLLDRRLDRGLAVRMLAVPLGSAVAACLTPIGPRLLATQVAVGERTSLIGEWGATDFREVPAFVLAGMGGVVALCWCRSGGVSWTRLLLLGAACGEAMLVSRMVACAAVLIAPLLAAALQHVVPAGPAPLQRGLDRVERRVLLGGAALMLAALAAVVPHTAREPGGVPAAFGPRLAALPVGSPVAVEDETGAWIEWRYPGLDPFIDGMFDAYSIDYVKRYRSYTSVAPGWQRFLADSGAQVGILNARSPLTDALTDRLGWRVVQRTGRWVFVVAPPGVPERPST